MADRIDSLDTLRGAAILMVMTGHFLPGNLFSGAAAWHVTSLGRGGVILFFLLSGYLIFWNVERQTTTIFLSRRAFKLFPAYWVSVLAFFALGYFVEPKWPIGTMISNLTMSQDVLSQPLLSGVYWTLLIELKFYILIAVQYSLLRDRWTVAVPLALIAGNLVIFLLRGHASLLLSYLPVFYVGIQIRRLQQAPFVTRTPLIVTTLAVSASLVLFDPYYGWWSCFYLVAAAIALMFAVEGAFSSSFLNFFGRISYSFYLYHAAIISVALLVFSNSPLIAITVSVVVSTLVASASYRLIEVHFVNFGKTHERLWRLIGAQGVKKEPQDVPLS